MRIYCKLILILSCLCCATVVGKAQEQKNLPKADSVRIEQTRDTVADEKGFNALEYSMQRRFRPKNMPFVNRSFGDHTFVLLQGVGERLMAKERWHYSLGGSGAVGFGKWLTATNGVKLTLGYGNFKRLLDAKQVSTIGVDFIHLFNWSAYLGGYNPSRFLEISTLEGVGYRCSRMDGLSNHAWRLTLGLNFRMKLGPWAHLFVEPLVAFNSDKLDHSGETNWHRYDFGSGANVGISVSLNESEGRCGLRQAGNSFFALTMGAQYQSSEMVKEQMGYANSMGLHVNFAIGKWYTPVFALRLSCFMGSNNWMKYDDGEEERARYMGVRLEGMLDIWKIIKGGREEQRFSLPLLFGPEIGVMKKPEKEDELQCFYGGLTGGLQFKYKFWQDISLFFEPRVSVVSYAHTAPLAGSGTTPVDVNYYDGVCSFNIGVEFRLK